MRNKRKNRMIKNFLFLQNKFSNDLCKIKLIKWLTKYDVKHKQCRVNAYPAYTKPIHIAEGRRGQKRRGEKLLIYFKFDHFCKYLDKYFLFLIIGLSIDQSIIFFILLKHRLKGIIMKWMCRIKRFINIKNLGNL